MVHFCGEKEERYWEMEASGLWSYFEWAENLKWHKSVCVRVCVNFLFVFKRQEGANLLHFQLYL